jgi:cell division protein FtsI/penicillin-binding protein 2
VIVHSSNVGTIKVGLSVGPQRFYDYIRRFGFGERTGVQLPGEAPGLVRRTEKWSMLSNASMSIGQEIGVTPLQIAAAMATVANGGMRVRRGSSSASSTRRATRFISRSGARRCG